MFGNGVAAPAATVFVFDQQVFFPTHNVVTDMFLRFTFRLVIHKGMNSKARMYVAHQVMEGRVSASRVEEFGEGGTGRNRLAVDDGGMDCRRHLWYLGNNGWVDIVDPKSKGFHGDEGFKRRNENTATKSVIGEAPVPIQERTSILGGHVFFLHEVFEVHFGIVEYITVLRCVGNTVFTQVKSM